MKKLLIITGILFSLLIKSNLILMGNENAISDSLLLRNKYDIKSIEAFADSFFIPKMEEYKIPGLIFVMVKDGEIFFKKGYGYADLENKIPANPDESVFHVGSISKVFTATAAMQLVERGKIYIDRDINEYLPILNFNNNYSRPITLRYLLSHTAGFRGRAIGSMTHDETKRISLEQYVTSNMPGVTINPGTTINYSNHGFYLAGYMVEKVSGLPFAEYVSENILKPLKMESSSFVPTIELSTKMAKGYAYYSDKYNPIPNDYSVSLVSPAGSLLSTASDIGKFMIAQLQGGVYQDQRILNDSICKEMQKQQFTNDERLPGTCLGFYEYKAYGQRAILHDGDVTGFSSRLFLIPDQNIGFFVCNNSSNSILRMQLTSSLMKHFFAKDENNNKNVSEKKPTENIEKLAGNYRTLRIGLEYFDKFEAASAIMSLSENDISSWIELEPLMYKLPNSNTQLVFRENDKGEITNLFFDSQQMPISYEITPWYDTSNFLWIPNITIFLIFLISLIIWLIQKFKQHKADQLELPTFTRNVKLYTFSLVLLNLVFILCFTLALYFLNDEFVFGIPFFIKILLIIPLISSLLTIGLTVLMVIGWKRKLWTLANRIHYLLITVTCIAFIIWLYHWNWLGFHY